MTEEGKPGRGISVASEAGFAEIFREAAQQAPEDWSTWQAIMAEGINAIKTRAANHKLSAGEEQSNLQAMASTLNLVTSALAALPMISEQLGYLELLSIELAGLLDGEKSKTLTPVSRSGRGRPRASRKHLFRVGRVGAAVEIMKPWRHTTAEAADFVLQLLKIEARKGMPVIGWQGAPVTLSSVEEWHSKCSSQQCDRKTRAFYNAMRAVAGDAFGAHLAESNAEKAVRWLLSGAERLPDLAPLRPISG